MLTNLTHMTACPPACLPTYLSARPLPACLPRTCLPARLLPAYIPRACLPACLPTLVPTSLLACLALPCLIQAWSSATR